MTRWWSGDGDSAPLRITLSHAAATATLEAQAPTLRDGRWDVALTLEVDGQWWAQPLLRLALEYAQRTLLHRYADEPDEPTSFESAVDAIEQAWNDGMPSLLEQSPGRLADQLLTGALFRPG